MKQMSRPVIVLADLMESDEAWGRAKGREVFQRLIDEVEAHPGETVFRVSLRGVRRVDISFASETVVELGRRYRGAKGFCLEHVRDYDMLENWDAAAERKDQPLMVWNKRASQVLGITPTAGNAPAFQFALKRKYARASDFATEKSTTVANASMKFNQLWKQGFLLRQQEVSPSGGREYSYYCIR